MNTRRNKLLLNLGVLGKQLDVSEGEDLKNLTKKMDQKTEESETDEEPSRHLEREDQDFDNDSDRTSCKSSDVDAFEIVGDTTYKHIIEDLKETNVELGDIQDLCLDKEVIDLSDKLFKNNDNHLLHRARSLSPEPIPYDGDAILLNKVRAKSAPPKLKTHWLHSALLLKKVSVGRSLTPPPSKKKNVFKDRSRAQSLPPLLIRQNHRSDSGDDNSGLRLVTPEPNRDLLNSPLSPRSGSSLSVASRSSIVSSAFDASSECSTPSVRTDRKKRKKNFIDTTIKRRKIQKDKWIDTRRKLLLNQGKKHESRNGNEQPAKNLKPACIDKCKLKCSTNFSAEKRKAIFDQFWALGDHQKQWIFIGKNTKRYKKKRMTTDSDSKRQFSVYYYLPSTDNETIKVCKTMFKNTLNISNQFIQSGIDKYDNLTGNCSDDLRGAHSNKKRVNTSAVVKSVCDHVNSFQPVESHYTRKDSNKLYLENTLNFTIMFKMYTTWAAERTLTEVATSVRQYRDIVDSHMNVGFFLPKKDQCDVCTAYKNNPDEDKEIYNAHQNNKNIARSLKKEDKNLAVAKPNEIAAATFDFQKILTTPHGETSSFYYKRKLSVFNFTVFDMGQKKGICYMWDETTAKRGSNEVASCLFHFISSRAEQEKGHTQQEGDSVHALIERTAKRKMIFSPQEWYTCVRWCKSTNDKYEVNEVSKDNILDFKSCINQMNWTKGSNNEKVKWNQVREIKVDVNCPNVIFYKYDLGEQESMSINCMGQSNPRTRSRLRERRDLTISEPQLLYKDSLYITAAKYKDLMSLCNQNLIPKNYHNFYKNLKYDEHSNKSDVSDTEQ